MLWVQKNVLYDFARRQMLWTFMSTLGIAIMERDNESILKALVYDTELQNQVGAKLNLTGGDKFKLPKDVRQNIARVIGDDLKYGLNSRVEQEAATLLFKGERAIEYGHQDIQRALDQVKPGLRQKWIREMETMIGKQNGLRGFQFDAVFKGKLEQAMNTYMDNSAKRAFSGYMHLRTSNGSLVKKWMQAFSGVIQGGMVKVMGVRWTSTLDYWFRNNWRIWHKTHKAYWVNAMALQTVFRGGPNLTTIAFSRVSQLLYTTPVWIVTYSLWTRYIGFKSGWHDITHGIIYGFLTNQVMNYVFVELYEKKMMDTWMDLEFSSSLAQEKQLKKLKHFEDEKQKK